MSNEPQSFNKPKPNAELTQRFESQARAITAEREDGSINWIQFAIAAGVLTCVALGSLVGSIFH